MNAPDHLDGLARALDPAGWSTRRRYENRPALLHVFVSELPGVGESVRVKAGTAGVPWFVASTGDPIKPCHDLAGTVAEIAARLGPVTELGHATRSKPRRMTGRIRRLVRKGR
ncbi:hypothetical protein [Actinomadura nitritigenes]|uniref:hypothetical protein n=1 Tax=Actinomadura nitritigenes TaxID=134602 RepID=UPI003D8E622F